MHLLALQKRRGGMAKSPTAIAAKFGSRVSLTVPNRLI